MRVQEITADFNLPRAEICSCPFFIP